MKLEKGGPALLVVMLRRDHILMYVFKPRKPGMDFMLQASEIAHEYINQGWKMVRSYVS